MDSADRDGRGAAACGCSSSTAWRRADAALRRSVDRCPSPYGFRVNDEWTPQLRLERARQREHVVSAVVRAQSEWPDILAALQVSESGDDATSVLQTRFEFTREQAMAVLDTQFRRVTRADRERVSDELVALRTEIAQLEEEL